MVPDPIHKDLQVIYEDNHLIAINKRPGDIVQGDKTGDTPLSEVVKCYVKDKYSKPGLVFLGVIHRLDRPVSGLVIFARTSKALTRMNAMFQKREVKKNYWAIVSGGPKENAVLKDHLKKNEKQNKSYSVEESTKGAKAAELSYVKMGAGDRYAFLQINPVTGRHHQIRAQLSSAGLLIKGDVKYGARRPEKDASICLHSRSARFIHPVTKEEIEIVADPPKSSLWDLLLNMSKNSTLKDQG